PTSPLKRTHTPPKFHCPTRRATIVQPNRLQPPPLLRRPTARSRRSKFRQSRARPPLARQLLRNARKGVRRGSHSLKDPGPTVAKKPGPARITKLLACLPAGLLFGKPRSALRLRRRSARVRESFRRRRRMA